MREFLKLPILVQAKLESDERYADDPCPIPLGYYIGAGSNNKSVDFDL
jgi:hypothetical protein